MVLGNKPPGLWIGCRCERVDKEISIPKRENQCSYHTWDRNCSNILLNSLCIFLYVEGFVFSENRKSNAQSDFRRRARRMKLNPRCNFGKLLSNKQIPGLGCFSGRSRSGDAGAPTALRRVFVPIHAWRRTPVLPSVLHLCQSSWLQAWAADDVLGKPPAACSRNGNHKSVRSPQSRGSDRGLAQREVEVL